MSPEIVLALSSTARIQPVADGLSLYETASGRALALNSTAAGLLKLVDGTTTMGEIVRALACVHGVEVEVARGPVEEALAALLDAGVLQYVTVDPT